MSRNILIFRVENLYKNGPYSQGPGPIEWSDTKHPTPGQVKEKVAKVFGWDELHKFYYGFRSLDELKNWFDLNDRRRLDYHHGFFVSVYEIPKRYCFFGNKQAMFLKSKAKFKYDLDISRI